MLKDSSTILYPLYIKVSEDVNGEPIYITLNDVDDLLLLYKEFFVYKEEKLRNEFSLKNDISSLSIEELIVFNDNRDIPLKIIYSQ